LQEIVTAFLTPLYCEKILCFRE